MAFGGASPGASPRRAGAGRRAGSPPPRPPGGPGGSADARDGSDSDSSFDSGSAGSGDVKEDGGANAGAFGAGPAYSRARTPPAPGRPVVGSGAGSDASPGPGVYAGASSARLARHVPAVTFGKPATRTAKAPARGPTATKPPSAKKAEKQSGGVWDPLGGVDPDAPGPAL